MNHLFDQYKSVQYMNCIFVRIGANQISDRIWGHIVCQIYKIKQRIQIIIYRIHNTFRHMGQKQ